MERKRSNTVTIDPNDYTQSQWEELCAIAGGYIDGLNDCYPNAEIIQTASGHVFEAADECEEKAVKVRAGEYGESEDEDGDGVDTDEWADQLDEVASILREKAKKATSATPAAGIVLTDQDRFDLLECIAAREEQFAVNDRTFGDYTSDDRTNFHAKMDRLKGLLNAYPAPWIEEVLNMGGRHGMPAVVESHRIISVRKRRSTAK
jgi:hypothetical protein